MTHQSSHIIIQSLSATEYEIPVVHKRCKVSYLMLGCLIVGFVVGLLL